MKGFLLALMMVSGAASAGTIMLERTGPCLYAYYCQNVNNGGGEAIPDLVYSPHYGRLSGTINGEFWDTGIYALGANLPSGLPTVTLTSVPLYDAAGNVIYVTVTFVGGQVTGPCHQSGRVCVFPHAPVYLTAGTIVTP
jgi:hypothetical protein